MKKTMVVLLAALAFILTSCRNGSNPAAPAQSMSVKYGVNVCLSPYQNTTETYSYRGFSFTKTTNYDFLGSSHTDSTAISPAEFSQKVYISSFMASSSRTFAAETALSLYNFNGFTAPAGATQFYKSTDDVEILCGDSNGVILFHAFDLSRDNTTPPGTPKIMDACYSYTLDSVTSI